MADQRTVTPEALYFELGSLAAEMPDLATGAITSDKKDWIERAAGVLHLTGGLAEKIRFTTAVENLYGALQERNAETITAIVQNALIKAENEAPAWLQGTFLIAGNTSEAFAAVRAVFATAQRDVLLVDGDADGRTLTDCAVLAPDRVLVRLLAEQSERNALLCSAARHWTERFGEARPLAVRLADAGTIHDKLIVVDRATAWAAGQPFNMLARRARTSLVRIPPQAAARMIAAHAAMWKAAEPLPG
jgi:hypothetical protein